jgi:hypothetical protein
MFYYTDIHMGVSQFKHCKFAQSHVYTALICCNIPYLCTISMHLYDLFAFWKRPIESKKVLNYKNRVLTF